MDIKYINGKTYTRCPICSEKLVPFISKQIEICSSCSQPKEEPKKESRITHSINAMSVYSELNAEYLQDNRERKKFKNRLIGRKRYKFQDEGNFTDEDWIKCLQFFHYECAYCGTRESNPASRSKYAKRKDWITQDHIVSLEEGGTHDKDNIVPACFSCNAKKQDFDLLFWYKQQDFYCEDRLKKIDQYLSTYRKKPSVNYING